MPRALKHFRHDSFRFTSFIMFGVACFLRNGLQVCSRILNNRVALVPDWLANLLASPSRVQPPRGTGLSPCRKQPWRDRKDLDRLQIGSAKTIQVPGQHAVKGLKHGKVLRYATAKVKMLRLEVPIPASGFGTLFFQSKAQLASSVPFPRLIASPRCQPARHVLASAREATYPCQVLIRSHAKSASDPANRHRKIRASRAILFTRRQIIGLLTFQQCSRYKICDQESAPRRRLGRVPKSWPHYNKLPPSNPHFIIVEMLPPFGQEIKRFLNKAEQFAGCAPRTLLMTSSVTNKLSRGYPDVECSLAHALSVNRLLSLLSSPSGQLNPGPDPAPSRCLLPSMRNG
ncbi:hypothetical protein RRG08_047036 [Elysia crispata]|uniref:Uncharacterized protein n=1 Tax=Elysia crispata TaxID=231223 RepID=A0AAE1E5A7_9GAST|nr:hypothetical protein RRG08_047036 [Elysia crispata]